MTTPTPPRRTTGLFVGGGSSADDDTSAPAKPAASQSSDRKGRVPRPRAATHDHVAPGDRTTRTVLVVAIMLVGIGVIALFLLNARAPSQHVTTQTAVTAAPPVTVEATPPPAPLADSVTRPKAPPKTTTGELANQVGNPSFEHLDAAGRPIGWASQVYGGSCEFTVTRDGRRSTTAVCVRSTSGGDGSWFTKVTVKPHTAYVMKCWARCENLSGSGRGAQINLHVGDVPADSRVDGRSDALTGTSDWKQLQFLFESGSLSEVQLNCLFGGWGQSTGTAWFDDIQLIELSSGR